MESVVGVVSSEILTVVHLTAPVSLAGTASLPVAVFDEVAAEPAV